ncbi:MAG: hypothetical protein IPK52_21670 [Chloroflexi bacterium]|nr:hypothetical protein [Chloroflexota bacterium]
MSTSSIITAAVADVRTKFISCADDIKPSSTNKGYSMFAGVLPYWTLRFVSMAVDDTLGKPLVTYNIEAEAIYHGWAVTQGVDGEAEQDMQLQLILIPSELRARPRFQSTDYTAGCGYFAPEGVQVTGARIVTSSNGSGDVFAVLTTLTIPLELQLEEGF